MFPKWPFRGKVTSNKNLLVGFLKKIRVIPEIDKIKGPFGKVIKKVFSTE